MAITPANTAQYIKEITLPSGTTYTIVDYAARQEIDAMSTTISSISSTVSNMSKYTSFLGVVSNSAAWTKIQDGSTTGTILVGSTTTTVSTGNIVIYKPSNSTSAAQEYIWDGSKWNFFGDISATNLGSLAYKNNASSSTKFLTSTTVANTNTAAITLTGTFTPTGSVGLTKTGVTLAISATSTNPGAGNTANYWIYAPAGSVSVTSNAVGSTCGAFLTSVTGRTTLTSLSTTAPVATTPAGGINYTAVSDHNLQLQYLVHSTANAISGSASANALKTVTKPTYYGGFSGTTVYVKPLSVTVTTAASFTGTAATVTASGAQKVASISSASSTVTVS